MKLGKAHKINVYSSLRKIYKQTQISRLTKLIGKYNQNNLLQ